jgi:hypothetical protein
MWVHFRDEFFFDNNQRCRDQRAQTELEAKIGLDRCLKVLLAAGGLEGLLIFGHQDSSQPADRRQDDLEEQQFVARPG